MRVLEEPVCIDLFLKNPVFTSLHLESPVHVVPPLKNNALSSLHKFLRNRLVEGGGGVQVSTPSTQAQSLAGSVTIIAKTTVQYSPGSSMIFNIFEHFYVQAR
jgi:hypothetical protein